MYLVAVPVAIAEEPDDRVALSDPLLLLEHMYVIGIQMTDMTPTGKSMCVLCHSNIAKASTRIVYQPTKVAHRFIHPGCCDKVPDALIPHSRFTLEYHLLTVVGPSVLALREAIDVALPLLL